MMALERLRLQHDIHSFPTRRSSDLRESPQGLFDCIARLLRVPHQVFVSARAHVVKQVACLGADHRENLMRNTEKTDRKSTRLNSSHLGISYAVFCLKKNKNDTSKTV